MENIHKQIIIDNVDVSGCRFYALQEHYDMESDGLWKVCYSKDCKYSICANNENCYYKQLKHKEQECERLKAEIKLSKEMLIQNTSETNKYTIPQIIEGFISDNYIDQQNEDGYTIPVFIQIENILDIKEYLEQQLDQLKVENEVYRTSVVANLDRKISKRYRELLDENDLLKQALQEIKKIAQGVRNYLQVPHPKDVRYEMDIILQKINEVNNV